MNSHGQQPSASPFPASPGKIQPLTFVLIHGSWTDASFWDGIAAELRAMGHNVHVLKYPGHDGDPNTNVQHAMLSRSVADYIVSHGLRDVVLVGHSFGGTIVQKTAELVPDRLKRMVFMDAFVLKDGESLIEEVPPQAQALFDQLRASSGNNTIMLPFPLFRETFANLATLEQARWLYDRIQPEPAGPLYEKLDLKAFYKLTTPRSYLYLTEDNVLPQGQPGYGWHPHMSSRLGLFRLLKSPGDHMSTARTHPRWIAWRLYEAGRD